MDRRRTTIFRTLGLTSLVLASLAMPQPASTPGGESLDYQSRKLGVEPDAKNPKRWIGYQGLDSIPEPLFFKTAGDAARSAEAQGYYGAGGHFPYFGNG